MDGVKMKAKKRPQTSLFDELIVDNFAGGGGASVGIELATGRPVDIAINHDPAAVLMHQANHPYTRHYREDVWKVNPREVCHGHPVALAWFSPDCKHFSKAKGGKPRSKKIRGLAWVAVKWAATAHPRVIMLENVEEFQTWGPLDKDGKPIKSQIGRTFRCFIHALQYQGYKLEYRVLRACDYGAPTIRKRFFLIARCDDRPIVWPEPTHGDPESEVVKSGKLKPWHTAAEIIDWSLPCPSIFDTAAEIKAKYQLHAVRPLAENTMKRVARGIDKFVLKNPKPFVINYKYENEPESAEKPLSTVTAVNAHLLATPYVTKFHNGTAGQSVNDPLSTVTAGGESKRPDGAAHAMGLIKPALEPWTVTNTTNATGHPVSKPIDTIRTGGGGGQMLIAPELVGVGGRAGQSRPRGANEPTATVTAKADVAVIAPSLIQYHSETQAGEVRGQRADELLRTVDASNRFAVTEAFLSKYYAGGYHGHGNAPTDPLNTVTAADHNAVVTSQLVQFNNHCENQTEADPLNIIPAQGCHFAESRAFLTKYYGKGEGQRISDPLATITAKARFGPVILKLVKLRPGQPCGHWPEIRKMLNVYCDYWIADDEILVLTIGNVDHIIVDIGLRMLTPRELFAAQGFPPDYIIDKDVNGKAYPKSEQVARCGNAVPPPFAAALVRANLPELCVKHCHSMAELRETMAV
jgi:DNA (cytosine-5)-methyltransferase 1